MLKKINAKGKNILVIGDTHLPFIHPNAHHFLAEIKNKFLEIPKKKSKTDYIVIHIGDEIDYHNLSFHQNEESHLTASTELEEALEWLHMKNGLYELFPKTGLCTSNHGSMVFRKAKYHSMPLYLFKSYEDILRVKNWSWHDEFLCSTNRGDVFITHGRTKIDRLVQSVCSSAVQGHFHGLFSIQNWKSPNSLYNKFGAQVGCLIDDSSFAFNYNVVSVVRPILGSLLITSDGRPQLLPMGLDKNNKWDGKI